MGIRKVFGMPFLSVGDHHVEDVAPLSGSFPTYSLATTMDITGMSQSQICSALFGSGGVGTFWSVYERAGSDTPFYFSGDGSLGGDDFYIICKGSLTTYEPSPGLMGMQYTAGGTELYRKNGINGQYDKIIDWANILTTGIHYPSENALAVNQYLSIGIVDNWNHISFLCMLGAYANAYGTSISSSAPRFARDTTMTVNLSSGDLDIVYDMFEDAPWTDEPIDDEPTIEEGGGWNIMDRYSPLANIKSVGMYALSISQLNNVNSNLWDQDFISQIKTALGLLTDPSEAIMSLRFYHGCANDMQLNSADSYVVIGNTPMTGSGKTVAVSTKTLKSQFIEHDCGQISIPEESKDYIDYLTDFKLYIPFYGFINLNASEIVGGTIGLKYNVDVTTGCAQAFVTLTNSALANAVIANVQCNVGEDIPINHQRQVDIETRAAFAIGGAIAAGVASGGVGMAAVGGLGAALTPKVQNAGSGIGPGYGYLGSLTPYLIVSRVVKANPDTSANAIGKKASDVSTIGSHQGFVKVKGLTEASMTALNGCKCKDRIIQALKDGVYV